MKLANSGKAGIGATYALLGIAFLSMLLINLFAYLTVINLNEKYATLNDAAMRFKLKILNANLLFREIASGYSAQDMHAVWSIIEDAKLNANSIRSVNADMRLDEDLETFRRTILDCYKAKNVDRPSMDLKRKYDQSIKTMIDKIDTFEDSLKSGINVKMGLVKLLYLALMVNIILIFSFIIYLVWRYTVKRRQYEEELIAAHNSLETLLNAIDSILITVDQKGVITQWNTKADNYFGMRSADMIGRGLFNVLPAFKQYQQHIETVFLSKHGKDFYREKLLVSTNHERFFNIKLVPISQAKGVSGVLLRADDVTEQEMHDELAQQSQKMQIVENIIGGLAHDFNNVLGAITGTISMMRFSIENKSSLEELSANIELIESSAERAVVMVQQMILMVQKQKAEMVQLDLNSSLLHVLRICQNSYPKSINIEANLYDVKSLVKADPVQLALVLLNLCDNAAQAMTSMRKEGEPQGGTLTISIDRICPDKAFRSNHLMATAHSYWIIAVKDTGVGIDKDSLPKIFDPFFTTKKPGEGTGLGLTVVGETLRAHGGFIEVSSEPGQGSVFKVYIPEFAMQEAIPPVPAASSSSSSKPIPLQPVRRAPADNGIPIGSGLVLIVDDEIIMRKTAKNILDKLGYQIITAEDGDEAVKIYSEKATEIALVLLDLSMPRMSGKEAYLEMKKVNPQIKAILVSGFKKDDRIQEVLNLGVNDFIQKPYTMQMLAQGVKKVISPL